MIDVLMLSNKSQYILSKIGIPLFEDNAKLPTKQELSIYFYRKNNILTLHLASVDAYPENEMKLLEAIMSSIQGEASEALYGTCTYVTGEKITQEQIIASNEPIKATLIFFDTKLFRADMGFIESPPLSDMVSNPLLKKHLWARIKPLTNN
ncbi:hypothetical protein N9I84_03450 [Gammaproteobacteria bacterium]|nr:hypothetical protein [Gammaproteobacteria bacterium]